MSAPPKMPLRTQYEERVLRHARKYARMKAFGSYVENDRVVRVSLTDRSAHLDFFSQELLAAASDLLDAMAIDEVDGTLKE